MKKFLFVLLLGITIFQLSACDKPATPVVDEKYELTDLTGKTQAEIETLFTGIDITVSFREKQTADVAAGKFMRYVGYTVGDKINFGTQLIIEIAASIPGAPVINGASEATVYVSVQGNPPTFDIEAGITATDYLGNDIPFGKFLYVFGIEDSKGTVLDVVNFYKVGVYKVTYRAQNSGLVTEVVRTINVVVPPFDTNYTDGLRLDVAYANKSFINDGIGSVTITSHTDADTTNFKDTKTGIRFTVRYLGIDAPEATSKYEPWGIKSANFVREILDDADEIILQAEGTRTDGNNRYLAWVWYKKDGVTRLLNLELVETAYAWTSGAAATQYGNVFTIAAAETQLTGKRIYGEVDPDFDYSTEGTPIEIGALIDTFDDHVGKKVTVSGVITSKVGNSIFLESNNKGIYIYAGYNFTNELQIGYRVTIQGLVAAVYFESMQLSNYKMENMILIEKEQPVTITTITASEIGTYVGRVVTFDTLTVDQIQLSQTDAYTVIAKDHLGGIVSIRVDATTATFVPAYTFTVGAIFKLSAVPVTKFHSGYQIMLPGMGSLSFIEA